jgi:flagellin
VSGVSAAADATVLNGAAVANTGTAAETMDLTINGVAIAQVIGTGVGATDAATLVTNINLQSAATGVTAEFSAANGVVMTAADGRNIDTTVTTTGLVAEYGMAATTEATGSIVVTSTATGGIDYNGTEAILGSTAADTVLSATGTAVSKIDISTAGGASTAITSIDAAIATISGSRSDLGSYQSRFESVVANAQTAAENLSASRSRIMDADFAQETAQLTKSQILQQSGIAMLAQANSIPQNVLALLQ